MSELAGSLLLRHGVVKPEQISLAHALRQKDGGTFGEALVRIGALREEQLVEFYHKRLMIPRISDDKLLIVSPKVLSLVPSDMAAEFRVLPVEVDNEGTITLAMADPTNNHAVDEVAFFADRFVVRMVASESAVRRAIETHYGVRFTSPRASDPTKTPPVRAEPPAKAPAPRVQPQPQPQPASRRAPVEPKPTREELEQQIVLLTKIKRSEETPLPAPIPPPPDLTPEPIRAEPSEPILLTKPKLSEPHDTQPGMTIPSPDPPLAALRAATERDQIAREVLDYIGLMTRRTIFFVIKKNLLVAQDARGDLDPQFVRELAINIEAPSIFRDVISSRLPYRGPLPSTAANRAFAQMLGGIGREVLLMPITIRDRIAAVLFADQPHLPLPDAALHATTREAGLAYERLILQQRGQ
jgi:hypothetical protein